MKAVSRFEVSMLILLMAEFYPDIRVTSSLIGASAGCNPVVVRNLYSKLKAGGLLESKPGPSGISLAKDPREITLWDVFTAVEEASAEHVFSVETPLNGTCTLSENIHSVLCEHLSRALDAMQRELSAVSLYDFAWQLPDTYEEPAEERLCIMRKALQEVEAAYLDEPRLD